MGHRTESPYIVFDNVEVKYSPYVYALRGVSLTVLPGEFVFFVGKTGAGKSTMLKLLSREASHTDGRVILDGRDLGAVRKRDIPALRRGMGIVPQDFALLPRKRVWENVAYAMRAVGATRKEVRKRVPEILEQVNIGHRADAYPHELSGGEQQRVAIARALINNPPLLLADEPTGNLDPEHSWGIMELLAELNAHGTTVLVASHDILVVERMDRRVVTLESGILAADSSAPAKVEADLPSHEEPADSTVEPDGAPMLNEIEGAMAQQSPPSRGAPMPVEFEDA